MGLKKTLQQTPHNLNTPPKTWLLSAVLVKTGETELLSTLYGTFLHQVPQKGCDKEPVKPSDTFLFMAGCLASLC